MNIRFYIILAALNMIMSIAAGAFGAHGLKQVLDSDMQAVWHTAVTYQMIHGIGIFLLALMAFHIKSSWIRIAVYAMFTGIILFSGSLYILALTGIRSLGMITPIGGTLFLIAWIITAYAAAKNTTA